MTNHADRYFDILQQVVLTVDDDAVDVHLAEALALSRTLIRQGVPPDQVRLIHHDAMVRLSGLHPDLTFSAVADRLARPLMDVAMAGGMAFREQMEQRYRQIINTRLEQLHPHDSVGTLAVGLVRDFNQLLGHVGITDGARDNLNGMIGRIDALLAVEQSMLADIAVNERLFRTLVENSPDIIMRFDRECRWIFVNPAYIRETGMLAEQVLYKSVDDECIWQPSMQRADCRKLLQHVMDTGIVEQILLEWTHPDGQWVSHEIYVVAEYDAHGNAIGALAIGRNVTQCKEAERQLQHQASYDLLTGLPNRRFFGVRLNKEIAKADRGGYGLAVLFIDLDRFKEVNDTLGHAVGDRLLIESAHRIQSCVRESDTVARFAGDEFVVILPKVGPPNLLERIAQNVVASMIKPLYFGEHSVYVSASVGIAIYPQDGENPEMLISRADQAMYAAKEAGRNNFCFFNRQMLDQVQQRMHLANDLRGALGNGQLEVYYQPIVEIAGGRVIKAEALLRWKHSELGMVPPDQFIPLAEETGLINDIGAWVFREAADTVKRWNMLSQCRELCQISVNMSPRQFNQGHCDQIIINYLRAYGLSPKHIAVEITEGLLLVDCPNVIQKMEKLRAAGIEISLDDFGTGYSAMAYLKKFNIDYLKIDRSFINDLENNPDDRAIAEAIIVMAHRLGLKVIAEGVETEGQYRLLADVGCEYMQGYLFAKPMPADEFLAFVGSNAQQLPTIDESTSQLGKIA